jgi:hypothetical protein
MLNDIDEEGAHTSPHPPSGSRRSPNLIICLFVSSKHGINLTALKNICTNIQENNSHYALSYLRPFRDFLSPSSYTHPIHSPLPVPIVP